MKTTTRVGLGLALMTVTGCGVEVVGPGADETSVHETRLVAADAGAPSGPRLAEEERVCAAWRAMRGGYTEMGGWRGGAASCDLGALPDATRSASIEWVNYFRALAGLAAVREDPNDRSAAQGCAVLMERAGQLSHAPAATWSCASLAARDAAARSNLSGNVGFPMSPWYAVHGWMDEARDLSMTLGHRRWLLSPELRTVTYGQTASFACMTLGLGARDPQAPAAVAWPPAGWVPTAVAGAVWSISQVGVTAAGAQVEVRRDGAPLSVRVVARPTGPGDDTLSWEMPAVVGGSVYEVTVRVPGRASVGYAVRPTACDR